MLVAHQRYSRRPLQALAVLLAAAMLGPAFAGLAPAAAQDVKAGVVTTLQGQAVVARPVIQQPLPLKFKDDVFVRDRVETREDSLVRILLGGKALVTVRELSSFTVTEEPNRAVIELRSGKAAIGVAPSLLRPGESIEVRTPNAVAGIRGSYLVTTVDQVGGAARTTFEAVRASKPITVATLDKPTTTIDLNTEQTVGVRGLGAQAQIGQVTTMPPAQVQAAIRAGEAARPKEQASTSPMASGIAAAGMEQATQLVAALQGGPTPDVLFQPATIKALGGGATENLASQLSVTSDIAQGPLPLVDAGARESVAINLTNPPPVAPPPPVFVAPPLVFVELPVVVEPPVTPPPVAIGPVLVVPPVAPPMISPPVQPPPVVVAPPPVTPPPVVVAPPPVTPPPVVVEPPPVTPPPVVVEPPPVTPPPVVVEPPPVTPPVDLADVVIIGETRAVPSGQSLKTFTGTSTRTATTPVVLIDQSSVTADSTLIEGGPGSQTTIAGPLLRMSNSDIHTDGNVLHLGSGTLGSQGASTLMSFNPSFVNAGQGIIRLDGTANLTVQGSLLSAVGTTFLSGESTSNVFPFLSLFDSATLFQFGGNEVPLLAFDASHVVSAGPLVILRRSPSTDMPTFLVLSGPLFRAVNGSTFTTMSLGFEATFGSPAICCSAFSVRQGAFLGSSTTEPLIQLSGGSWISSGPSERSGSSFFSVSDTFSFAPAGELVAPSFVSLQGPLLRLSGESRVEALNHLLDVTRSVLVSVSPQALIELEGGSAVRLGGLNPFTGNPTAPRFLNLDGESADGQPAIVLLHTGSLLRAVDASIESRSTAALVGVVGGAILAQQETSAPLMSFDASRVDTGGSLVVVSRTASDNGPSTLTLSGPLFVATKGSTLTMTGDAIGVFGGGELTGEIATSALVDLNSSHLVARGNSGNILHVDVVGEANGMTGPTAHLQGPLLNAANGSTLDITGGFVAAANGGQVVVSGPGASNTLVSVEGGSHAVATGANRAMFGLSGRSASVIRDASGLVVSADEPLQHEGRLLDTNNARLGEVAPSGRFVGLDRALLEASLPLLAATNGSLIRTGSNAIDMSASRLTAVGDLIQLNASRFDVVSGALASVAGGSHLKVGGNLVSLANGSTLNLLNGPVLNVSGNSLADISGALIGFSGAGNAVNITNNLCSAGCSTIGGLRVRLDGTPANNVAINGAITGAGAVNLSGNAAHVSVSGAGSRVIIGPR